MASNTLKSIISEGKLKHWQIAFDGKWEEVIEIQPTPSKEQIDEICSLVLQGSKDIALEAFFKKPDGEEFFFGLRLADLSATEKESFIRSLEQATANGTDFESIFGFINKQLLGAVDIECSPDLLEMGFEGFWKSKGPYTLWKPGQTVATVNDVNQNAPHLLEPFERAAMIEFAWNTKIPHWIGLPAAKKQKTSYVFSPDSYNALTKLIM